jgi:O-antigen ligase/tetratricopeptide (TPR) repeat protein
MKQAASFTTNAWGKRTARDPADTCSSLCNLLLQVVDLGLIGVICVAPFFFGGRHDLGRLVVVSLIAVTAAAWFVRQSMLRKAFWPRTSAYAILLLAAAMLIVQIVPLPAAWCSWLAPNTERLLPLWSSDAGVAGHMDTWLKLSLIPHETTKSLAMLLSYGLLFAVVTGRIQTVRDVRRILSWVASASVAMALFGVLQYFTSGERFFWFYDHPHRSASQTLCGAFINRNHFAHFLVLGMGPLLAWLLHVLKQASGAPPRKPQEMTPQKVAASAIAAAVLIVALAALGSGSRGGAIVLVVATAVFVTIGRLRGVVDSRVVYSLAGMAAVVAFALSLQGYGRVVERLDDLTEGSLEELDHNGIRRKVWAANAASIQDCPFVGTGAGSHREICPAYFTESFADEYSHAENGYLQIATENGAIGVALLVAAMVLIGYWCAKCVRGQLSPEEATWFGATAAGLVASAIHSLVDFVWYIPACMSVTIVLAACVLRLSHLASNGGSGTPVRLLPRGRWIELATAVVLVGGCCVHTYVGPGIAAIHWNRYLRASVADSALVNHTMSDFVSGKGVEPPEARRTLALAMIKHLERTLAWDPEFARAHRRLADRYVAQFELGSSDAANVLDVTQIRDAAMASTFGSAEELRSWLLRAFGPKVKLLHLAQRHARRSLELCPLQGDAYLRLSELAFLDLGTQEAVDAYIVQALAVRPYDRNVLMRAGRQELLIGRTDVAVQHWTKCFSTRGRHQQEIAYRLAPKMTAQGFLSAFRPDWNTLPEVWAQYKKFDDATQLYSILDYAATETRRATADPKCKNASVIWYWQSELYTDIGRSAESLACLQRANARDPRQYFIRRALAKALHERGELAEAESHVRWCLARRPTDGWLNTTLDAIVKARREQGGIESFDGRWKPSVTLASPTADAATVRN